MRILAKKAITFTKDWGGTAYESFSVTGENRIVEAPDWVRESQAFVRAAWEGGVVEIGGPPLTQPPPVDVPIKGSWEEGENAGVPLKPDNAEGGPLF
jgi:hypothetical protein